MFIRRFLTADERERVIAEARRRQRTNEGKGLKGRNSGPATGGKALQAHYIGAAGEMVVASFLGLAGDVFGESSAWRGSSDLPGKIDVKTRARHSYDLIVQHDEDDDKFLILVTLERCEFRIHGWILAAEAKRPQWWADPAGGRAAYFVPKRVLIPIDSPEIALRS
jgi:hypothetical protein